MSESKNKVITGLMWSFAERFGAQIVSFVVSIVLARLLLPKDYGTVTMVTVFINIANAFVTGGFGNSLIQKKGADDLDFSTVFFFNIFFSVAVYLVIFSISPLLESFYNQDGLAMVTRVLGLRLLLTGVNSIQRAYVARNMQFKKFFFATLGGTLLSAVVGIVLAYKGLGVWALIAQYLTNTTTDTVVLWLTVKWRPKFMFSFKRLKSLLSYGWKLLCSSLLSTVYAELNELVIGKYYSSADLAFYSKGKKFPALFVTNINSAVETVLFPSMSKIQDEHELLKAKTKASISYSTFLVLPIVFGLAAVSDNLIPVLLTDKWQESSVYLMIACLSYAFVPVGMANLQAIKAIGKSTTYLVLDIIKKIMGISLLVVSLKYGVYAIAIAEMVSNVFGFLLNIYPNKKYLNYGFVEQLKDILPSLILSLIMFTVVYSENYLPVANKLLLLIIQLVTGVTVYFLSALLSKNPQFIFIINLAKAKLRKVTVKE